MNDVFDPRDRLMTMTRKKKLPNGEWQETETQYLETKWRIVWLFAANPDAEIRIDTQLMEHEPGKRALFKATVVVGNRSATGWATKDAGGAISYIENAETHALGRALAALGYGTANCDDYADGEDAEGEPTPVDSPTPRNGPAHKAALAAVPAATDDLIRLLSVAREVGFQTQKGVYVALGLTPGDRVQLRQWLNAEKGDWEAIRIDLKAAFESSAPVPDAVGQR